MTTCPNCGARISEAGGQCPSCKSSHAPATGLLTPVPNPDAETVYIPPSQSRPAIDDEATFFGGTSVPPAPPQAEPPDADTTGLPPSAGGVRQRPKEPTGPLRVGQQFGARYHILKQLGIGGMGAVYQAWDAELEVAVAVKVIRPEVTQDPAAAQDIERRFKQELLLARQVTHKNVVRIHDLGEIEGIKYITMPYIDGADLATVLRGQKLTIPKIMALARQIASGLQAAHEAGVVHRDLKPANVMIESEEHAIIMDFGIARSTSRGGSAPAAKPVAVAADFVPTSEDDRLTRVAATVVGEVIGTIEYMAPEQARGEHVDQRADVYAFGLILYDMLTGRRRSEHAVSAVGELQKRLAEPPPPVRTVVPAVPEPLDALVTRCVEPDPDKRFQTTAELVAAIDRLDDNGRLRPIKRVVGMPLAVGVVLLLVASSAGIWWYQRQFIPPPTHENVAVVIADLQNNTGDATFDGTLEPMMRRALDEAGFITAFDRSAIRGLGVEPPVPFNETAALLLAAKQSLGVVLSGSIERQGDGYQIDVKLTQAVAGTEIATARRSASSRDQVLQEATRLMTRVRNALGDDESESSQMFAMTSLSTTSLDVIRQYAAAMEAAANARFDEARQGFLKAVEIDPNFGLGYQSLASVSRNVGQLQEAKQYIDEALRHLSSMTERERLTTRGLSLMMSGDYEQCVKEYGDLIERFSADVGAHNQRALCLSQLRDLSKAQEEMRQVTSILPKHVLFRDNLALYAAYAGDFPTAERESRALPGPDVYATLARAFAQTGQEQLDKAEESYRTLQTMQSPGASIAASGLGDLAAFRGRFSEAASILEDGARADVAAKSTDRAGAKYMALANVQLSRGQTRAAVAAADAALANSQSVAVKFLAARTFVEANAIAKARPLMDSLAGELQAEPRAYAKILEGLILLKGGEARKAVGPLSDANTLFDTWIGHFDLGRAYLAAEGFIQADAEFDRCLKRRGEALSLFLDEEPTYAYLPAAYYYLGRARQQNGSGGQESFQKYLDIRGASTEDPLVRDIKGATAG